MSVPANMEKGFQFVSTIKDDVCRTFVDTILRQFTFEWLALPELECIDEVRTRPEGDFDFLFLAQVLQKYFERNRRFLKVMLRTGAIPKDPMSVLDSFTSESDNEEYRS